MRVFIYLLFFTTLSFSGVVWQGQFNVPQEKTSLYPSHRGYYELRINGVENYGHTGEPKLPYIHRTVSLAGSWSISDVRVTGNWSEPKKLADGAVLVPVARPNTISSGIAPQFIPDETIYRADKFFPHFSSRWDYGSDGDSTYIHIHIPIVRYNPVRGEYLLLSCGEISIYGKHQQRSTIGEASLFDDVNIVLTVSSLRTAAESLAALHDEWGVPSAIITVEEIASSYSAAEYPPYWGFPAETPTEFTITADTELAMKIISFLRDDDAHPYLQSITILGDATQIPPSYYFRDSTDIAWGGDEFNAYVPTDFFYSSPDYDWVPNFSVGRIPTSDESSAISFIYRLRQWHDTATPEMFNRVLFAGGNPFQNLFDGEHTCMLICRDGYVSNAYIRKLYASRGEFTASIFNEQFQQPYGIVYIFGHGSGHTVHFDDGTYWSTGDVEALPYRDFGPAFMMGSCLNGIYDGELVGRPSPQFPKALLQSMGGPIAFWGASRTAYSSPDYYFDGAEIIITEPYNMSRYNFDFIVALAVSAPENFGEWDNAIKYWYTDAVDMNSFIERRTFLEYNLFGDPALPLPEYNGAAIPDVSGFNCPEPTFIIDDSYDDYAVYLTDYDSLRFTSLNDVSAYLVPMVNYEPTTEHLVTSTVSTSENFAMLPAGGGSFYCLSADSPQGVEARYYFYASVGKICANGFMDDWNYNGFSYVASDGYDFSSRWLDMLTLYTADDAEYLYVGFTTGSVWDADWLWHPRIFTVAIDAHPGGYAGVLTADTDPMGTFVCFSPETAPDLSASIRWSYDTFQFRVFRWLGGEWIEITSPVENGLSAAYRTPWSGTTFGEVAIPRWFLSHAESVNIIVYSALGAEENPAQDCVPSDDATFSEITLGSGNANRLTSFYTYHFTTPENISEGETNLPERLSVILSPNPFNSLCRISLGANCTTTEIKIFDISGRCILSHKISAYESEFIWDAGDMPSGVYLIDVSNGSSHKVKRAILVR